MRPLFLQVLLAALFLSLASGFLHHNGLSTRATIHLRASEDAADPNEIIAKRIKLSGDCQGGYYRACVKNEVSTFIPYLSVVVSVCLTPSLRSALPPSDRHRDFEIFQGRCLPRMKAKKLKYTWKENEDK